MKLLRIARHMMSLRTMATRVSMPAQDELLARLNKIHHEKEDEVLASKEQSSSHVHKVSEACRFANRLLTEGNGSVLVPCRSACAHSFTSCLSAAAV